MARIELVDSEERLAEVTRGLSTASQVAVDVESNGFFRYRERVCLVQLASGDEALVIDPLAMDDLQPLGALLANPSVEKLFHAAGNDIRSLHRDWGFRVANLFDTSVAAAFVGSIQLGMQAVLKEHVEVELAKPKNLQRSDWSLRPLGEEALEYAADDVLHLSRARDVLVEKLDGLSRLEWVREECERLEEIRHTPANREMAFLSTRGSQQLDEKALAVLRRVYEFRDEEAQRLDRPLFKVFPDSALVQLASDPQADLSSVKGLGRYARPPASRGLRDAIGRGLASEPFKRPERERPANPLSPEERKEADARLRALKSWRSQLGEDLKLNPGLLWPAASLERLARHPESLDAELAGAEVRHWQGREFGSPLRALLRALG